MEELKPGITGEVTMTVLEDDLATNYGNPGVDVLATPRVVALAEEASVTCISPYLPDDVFSVGTWLEIRHLAPTPEGMKVTALAKLVSREERKLTFEITVQDEKETVATLSHDRYMVNRERFLSKARAKGE